MSQSKVGLSGAHGLSALIPRRRNGRCRGFSIGLLFSEDPVGRFGQVSGHGADGLLMALAPGDALVEAAGVDAWGSAGVGGQLLGGGEARNAADFEPDDDGEHESYSGKSEEQLNRGRGLEYGCILCS